MNFKLGSISGLRESLHRWLLRLRSARPDGAWVPHPQLTPDFMKRKRHEYKAVWTELASTDELARLNVLGAVDEDRVRATAEETLQWLEASVGIKPDDVILDIGCGIGRVGQVVAPKCKHWIGCDVSPNMLKFARQRLASFDNVSFVEISGFDLRPILDTSVDLVYCTVVFMHLDEWDRYNYVLEAYRVLRPGGRIFVDNFNLCTDEGWQVFETHRRLTLEQRGPSISKSSTPQEITAYLQRAGFRDIKIKERQTWLQVHGVK